MNSTFQLGTKRLGTVSSEIYAENKAEQNFPLF